MNLHRFFFFYLTACISIHALRRTGGLSSRPSENRIPPPRPFRRPHPL